MLSSIIVIMNLLLTFIVLAGVYCLVFKAFLSDIVDEAAYMFFHGNFTRGIIYTALSIITIGVTGIVGYWIVFGVKILLRCTAL